MRKELFYRGRPGITWGIFNLKDGTWEAGIEEDTPMLAQARLYQRHGFGVKKGTYEMRMLPGKRGGGREWAEPIPQDLSKIS